MNQEKRKRALALFEQPIDSENIAPYRNKYFHTTMAQDSLANLDIDIDYENYSIITNGGDIVIIDPDDPDTPIIIRPEQLKAHWISYITPEGASATNVQDMLDELYANSSGGGTYDYDDLINKPSINGVVIQGLKNGQDYKLVNGQPVDGKGGPIPDGEIPQEYRISGGPITNIASLLNL